ncbi:MAG: hydroxymethylbilane synthase [Pseudomonadota bacterium]
MSKKTLTIATRESQLALQQANWAMECLQKAHPDLAIQLLPLSTKADRSPDMNLQEVGGKGLFVKELEEALLDGRADIAVHCMKDMPVALPPGLCLAAMSVRETPYDVLVSNQYDGLSALPDKAIVGTSSLRRKSQLLNLRPDLQLNYLRGNVITRLARLDSGEYDAIILAAAGLKRLGLLPRLRNVLVGDEFLPAAGQGILGIECRQDDLASQQRVQVLHNETSLICVTAERALCKRLGAQCQTPVAAYAVLQGDQVLLKGFVGSEDGKQILRAEKVGSRNDAVSLGEAVGDALLKQGAGEILASCLARAGGNAL